MTSSDSEYSFEIDHDAEPHLNVDGPHTASNTVAVSRLIRECFRVLNHATLAPRARKGVGTPEAAYLVVGALSDALARFPQLAEQLCDYLESEASEGRVAMSEGQFSGQGEPGAVRAMATVASELAAAKASAQALSENLEAARRVLANAAPVVPEPGFE